MLVANFLLHAARRQVRTSPARAHFWVPTTSHHPPGSKQAKHTFADDPTRRHWMQFCSVVLGDRRQQRKSDCHELLQAGAAVARTGSDKTEHPTFLRTPTAATLGVYLTTVSFPQPAAWASRPGVSQKQQDLPGGGARLDTRKSSRGGGAEPPGLSVYSGAQAYLDGRAKIECPRGGVRNTPELADAIAGQACSTTRMADRSVASGKTRGTNKTNKTKPLRTSVGTSRTCRALGVLYPPRSTHALLLSLIP